MISLHMAHRKHFGIGGDEIVPENSCLLDLAVHDPKEIMLLQVRSLSKGSTRGEDRLADEG